MNSLRNMLFLVLITIAYFPIFAQDTTTKTPLAEEFTKLENYLRNKPISAEEKKKNLESNILSALKVTLGHKLENPRKELKDIKFQELQTERFPGTNQFYVKFKAYYMSYTFPVDPEIYKTSPYEEKFLEKPEGTDLAGAHSEDKK